VAVTDQARLFGGTAGKRITEKVINILGRAF